MFSVDRKYYGAVNQFIVVTHALVFQLRALGVYCFRKLESEIYEICCVDGKIEKSSSVRKIAVIVHRWLRLREHV